MRQTIKHKFVEFIPAVLEEGILYISVEYGSAIHNCACGCGKRVVTPFSPNDWIMTFDGETVSLSPSIGNWNFPCQSHYFIKNNNILRAKSWLEMNQDVAPSKKLKHKKKHSWNWVRKKKQKG